MKPWVLVAGTLLLVACRHQSYIDEPVDPANQHRVEVQGLECMSIQLGEQRDRHGHWRRCQTLIAPATIESFMPEIEAEEVKYGQLPDFCPGLCPYVINALVFGERGSWWYEARKRVSRLCCERKRPDDRCPALPR